MKSLFVLAIFLTKTGSVHPPSTLCFIVLNELGGTALVIKGNTKTWFHKQRWQKICYYNKIQEL